MTWHKISAPQAAIDARHSKRLRWTYIRADISHRRSFAVCWVSKHGALRGFLKAHAVFLDQEQEVSSVLQIQGELDLSCVQSLRRLREAGQGMRSISIERINLNNICVIEK